MDIQDQKQPYSLEAEQSVLGSIIIDASSISEVISILQPSYFYLAQHRAIYSCLVGMFDMGKQIDAVTLLDEMQKSPDFDEVNSRQYILQLAESVPTSRHIKSYATIIRDRYYLRALIEASSIAIDEASDASTDAETVIDAAEQRIMNIRSGKSMELKPLSELIGVAMDRLSKMADEENKEEFVGLPTGFSTLDSTLTGLHKGNLIILAARPGIGKSAFSMNIAQNVAKQGKAVAVFSLEMSGEEIIQRTLSTEALIDNKLLRSGEIKPDDWTRIAAAVSALYSIPLYIDDSAGITVPEMKAKLRRIKNLGLVVIDYLQLMNSAKRTENRVTEVADITRSIKIMAKELNVPIIALSQMSRESDKRKGENSMPMLSDLRESGSIEQDADVVIFLHQENRNQADEQPESIDINVIIAKNRHGERKKLRFKFAGKYTRFSAVTDDYSDDQF